MYDVKRVRPTVAPHAHNDVQAKPIRINVTRLNNGIHYAVLHTRRTHSHGYPPRVHADILYAVRTRSSHPRRPPIPSSV